MDAVPASADGVVVADLGEELALLLPDSGDTLLLNPSATQIWTTCDGSRSVSEVVSDLRRRFPDAPDLADEVRVVIDDFVQRGFLVWLPESLDR